jgi:hypothetical protein
MVRIDGLFGKIANRQTPFEKAAIELLTVLFDISNSSLCLAASESFSLLVVDPSFFVPSNGLFLSLLAVQFV